MGKKYNYIKIVVAGDITEWSGDVLAARAGLPDTLTPCGMPLFPAVTATVWQRPGGTSPWTSLPVLWARSPVLPRHQV